MELVSYVFRCVLEINGVDKLHYSKARQKLSLQINTLLCVIFSKIYFELLFND